MEVQAPFRLSTAAIEDVDLIDELLANLCFVLSHQPGDTVPIGRAHSCFQLCIGVSILKTRPLSQDVVSRSSSNVIIVAYLVPFVKLFLTNHRSHQLNGLLVSYGIT